MKKIIKNKIVLVVLTAIIVSSVSVYATNYLANQITYNKHGQATVADALDDLYNKKNSGCVSGEFEIVQNCTTSTGCDFLPFEVKKLYFYNLNSTTEQSWYYDRDKNVFKLWYKWNSALYEANVNASDRITINSHTYFRNIADEMIGTKIYYMACK